MHDAKQSLLSRITVGDTILAVPGLQPGMFGFGRPKDTTAKPCEVTAIDVVPDQWTGKVYTVLLADGRKSDGRYGTAHVYVTPPAKPERKKAGRKTRKVEDHPTLGRVQVTHVPGLGDLLEPVEPQRKQPEVEVDTESGPKRVVVEPDGTARVKGWKGGEVFETTPHGKRIRIATDGVITVLEDGGERPARIEPEDDEPMSEDEAQRVINSDRCGTCKGFGVVRKRGSNAGKNYRTLSGAEQATAGGNSAPCPACKGEGLLARTA